MLMFEGQRCVTVDELTHVVSYDNYKKLNSRGQLVIVRRGGNGNCALIEYDSLPTRVKTLFDAKFPTAKEELERAEKAKIKFVPDDAFRQFYKKVVLPNGEHMSEKVVEECTANATLVQMMVDAFNTSKNLHNAAGTSHRPIDWKKAWEVYLDYHKFTTLPESEVTMRKKFNAYNKERLKSLIPKKLGNNNARKMDNNAADYLIALRRSKVPVYTIAQIAEKYNENAPSLGFEKLTRRRIEMFFEEPDIKPLWLGAVAGEQVSRQKYQRKQKTELPSLPHTLWYSDGTKLNLYYKEYVNGGGAAPRLVVRTTSVYEVMDAHSEVFLGYFISDTENYEAQYNAFRMAIEVAGVKPYEIVNDNQGGHKKLEAENFFSRICMVSRRTAPYNGSSKTIENAFGRFQQQILHKLWYFTGQNVTTKKLLSKPNLEFIDANKELLPTLAELKEVYKQMRAEWNNSEHPKYKGKTRLEVMNAQKNPNCKAVGKADMMDMFWQQTAQMIKYTSQGIKFTIDGTQYQYEVLKDGKPDMEFYSKNIDRKFYVRYDPKDMTTVQLLKENSNKEVVPVAMAMPFVKIHRAILEQTDEERRFYREQSVIDKNERVKRELNGRLISKKFGMDAESQGLVEPELKGLNLGRKQKKAEEVLDLGKATKALSYADFADEDDDDILTRI